jgi:5-methylcytosine-specific restriction enzyme A
MAVTDGHGNPAWSREETILALDLYFRCNGVIPSKADGRVAALSELLRSLPYHDVPSRRPTFRNTDGVVFKLQNLKQVATGRGLTNVSQMDKRIWEEFGNAPDRIAEVSASIVEALKLRPHPSLVLSSEEEFAEGRLLTSLHIQRERSPKLRAKLLAVRFNRGLLSCDICNCTSVDMPKGLEDAIFEVHHTIGLSVAGPRITRLSDVALLCACCHRLLHRMISAKGRWVGIDEIREFRSIKNTLTQVGAASDK